MNDRETIFKFINKERDYQDNLGSDRTDGRVHSVAEELVLMQVYLNKAFEDWTNNAGDTEALFEITKVAALVIRCLENNTGEIEK